MDLGSEGSEWRASRSWGELDSVGRGGYSHHPRINLAATASRRGIAGLSGRDELWGDGLRKQVCSRDVLRAGGAIPSPTGTKPWGATGCDQNANSHATTSYRDSRALPDSTSDGNTNADCYSYTGAAAGIGGGVIIADRGGWYACHRGFTTYHALGPGAIRPTLEGALL